MPRAACSRTGCWPASIRRSPPSTRARCRRERSPASTTSGRIGWGGPQPPRGHGPHRYVFTLIRGLQEPLDLDPGASATTSWARWTAWSWRRARCSAATSAKPAGQSATRGHFGDAPDHACPPVDAERLRPHRQQQEVDRAADGDGDLVAVGTTNVPPPQGLTGAAEEGAGRVLGRGPSRMTALPLRTASSEIAWAPARAADSARLLASRLEARIRPPSSTRPLTKIRATAKITTKAVTTPSSPRPRRG